eukprot:CAMPEP_0174706920 /NCGR_PEP_ID=MMETSP1094-20130205/9592_1 /TAXON_ID=156173 /ORGANISM="Chrysochromulina brevifilum, Strain UTEX LB 985" /LENGTH=365 /DNA_ID=CAMNT_0015905245 /DNA_START=1 /DNA_END=1095 /DNA_ORIENTATION=+
MFRLALGVSIDQAFECQRSLHGWSGEDPATVEEIMAGILMYLWLVISAILLLNMLIANMTKSFEAIHEQSAYIYKFMFAHNVTIWNYQAPAPPPLSLIRLPSDLYKALCCPRDTPNRELKPGRSTKRLTWLSKSFRGARSYRSIREIERDHSETRGFDPRDRLSEGRDRVLRTTSRHGVEILSQEVSSFLRRHMNENEDMETRLDSIETALKAVLQHELHEDEMLSGAGASHGGGQGRGQASGGKEPGATATNPMPAVPPYPSPSTPSPSTPGASMDAQGQTPRRNSFSAEQEAASRLARQEGALRQLEETQRRSLANALAEQQRSNERAAAEMERRHQEQMAQMAQRYEEMQMALVEAMQQQMK